MARRTDRRPRHASGERSPGGRETVVFDTISPWTPPATQVSTSAANASSLISGAIFTSSGGRVGTRSATARRIARNWVSPWRSRRPGVFGEETLITA